MIKDLILFCGGPAIYRGNVPKPLQLVSGKLTLLEMYLETPSVKQFTNVALLCEQSFLNHFSQVADRYCGSLNISIAEMPNGSSTLDKLLIYLRDYESKHEPVIFSYPDVFYFGDVTRISGDVDWNHQIGISIRNFSNRFPRIFKDTYARGVKSISNHHSAVPANPVFMFAGHLFAAPFFLKQVLFSVESEIRKNIQNLEFDAFSLMISQGVVFSLDLYGEWLQVDSERDLSTVKLRMGFERAL